MCRPNQMFSQWHHVGTDASIFFRKLALEPLRNRRHLCLGRRGCHVGLQTPESKGVVVIGPHGHEFLFGVRCNGTIEVDASVKQEARRQDSGHGHRLTLEQDSASEQSLVAREVLLPRRVRNPDHRCGADFVVRGCHAPTLCDVQIQNRKEIAGHQAG